MPSKEKISQIRAQYGDRERDNSLGADAIRDLLSAYDKQAAELEHERKLVDKLTQRCMTLCAYLDAHGIDYEALDDKAKTS